jgi:hypothetical protein
MPDRVHGIVIIDRPHLVNGYRHPPVVVETLHCNVSTLRNITPRNIAQRNIKQRDITKNPSSEVMRRMMSEISPDRPIAPNDRAIV